MPTQEQNEKILSLQLKGYYWDKNLSISYAGVVMTNKSGDKWLFGMNGEIDHINENKAISIKTN